MTASSTLQDCLTAAKTIIDSLTLPDSASGAWPDSVIRKLVVDQNLGDGKGTELPAIILAPATEMMPNNTGTNNLDDVTYGVWCVLITFDNKEKTLVVDADVFAACRQIIAKKFRSNPAAMRAAGATTIIDVSVQPGEFVNQEAWKANLLASPLLLKFISREPRTP